MSSAAKVAELREEWIRRAAIFTLSGLVTSALIGLGLSELGNLLMPPLGWLGFMGILTIAVAALVRETELLSLPLPQFNRQTGESWGKILHPRVAAMCWGLDLGLLFTTRLTFAGAWVIATAAVALHSLALGVGLVAAYWLGRALTIWTAPLLIKQVDELPELVKTFSEEYRTFRRVHVVGLLWAFIVISVALAQRFLS